MDEWRLIESPRLTGARNMAQDEAILRASESGSGMPALRLYGWSTPTVSIGCLQNAAPLACHGLPLVRRITGGRAVLHDREITYSVIAPNSLEVFSGGILDAYSAISRCIIEALRDIGVEATLERAGPRPGRRPGGGAKDACFHTPSRYEVMASGKKLVGSAQRRFKRTFLQHGSILFAMDEGLNARIFGGEVVKRMTTIGNLSGISEDDFRPILIKRLSEGLNASFVPSRLTEEEDSIERDLLHSKYLSRGWNLTPGGAPGEGEGLAAG
ncbi:MAG: lipoate--protein ligase family protein [Deltaproteobacteria bacterium]|nr:lipoate--protein ligase family protein [Deltaproteobacteria bacterium]MBI5902847.1 lipoate--protein ligase family protein [Deltaproteobacteria bacterium]